MKEFIWLLLAVTLMWALKGTLFEVFLICASVEGMGAKGAEFPFFGNIVEIPRILTLAEPHFVYWDWRKSRFDE